MKLNLIRADIDCAELIWKMRVEAFEDLYMKYKDAETSPATEDLEKVVERLSRSYTYYYLIEIDEDIVGAIRVVDEKPKRISPLFILKKHRGKGFAQAAINGVEAIHGLDNFAQEHQSNLMLLFVIIIKNEIIRNN